MACEECEKRDREIEATEQACFKHQDKIRYLLEQIRSKDKEIEALKVELEATEQKMKCSWDNDWQQKEIESLRSSLAERDKEIERLKNEENKNN